MTAIDRTRPLTLNWTGSGFEQVYVIIGTTAVIGKDSANNNIVHSVNVTCQVPAVPGSFTIPADVLSHLLPATIIAASQANGSAMLAVQTSTTQPFNAPLVSGGQATFASFSSIHSYSRNLSVQ